MEKMIALILQALISVESGGDLHAVGDHGTAWGCLQIRQVCLDDVTRIQGIWYRKGKIPRVVRYTKADCFDRAKSEEIACIYLTYWGRRYFLETGKPVTPNILARMWNSGGWRVIKDERRSEKYAAKVHAFLDAKGKGRQFFATRL